LAVSDFRPAIAEKSLVKDVALIVGVELELELEVALGVLELDDEPLLPHAEMTRASPAAIDVRTTFLLRRFN
jgi:hypothetical protein